MLTSNDLACSELDGGETELTNIGFEFSRSDINDLAQKLASAQLTEGEQALLLAIFWVARESVGVIPATSPANSEQTAAGLQEQILKAFIPAGDSADDNFILQLQASQDRITPPIPIKPTPIKPTPNPNPDPPSPPTPA
jgi:hypothetical protein